MAGDEKTTDGKQPVSLSGQLQKKPETPEEASRLVVICASTGGPLEIKRILSLFKAKIPAAVIIVEQAHSKFTKMLMGYFSEKFPENPMISIGNVKDGEILTNGRILFSPEGVDVVIKRENGQLVLRTQKVTGNGGASFDVLLKSVADIFGKNAVGVLLSGDTEDGVKGIGYIKQVGGITIVQDPTLACASPNMPRCAIKSGNAMYVVKLDDIPGKIIETLKGGPVGQQKKLATA
jgi:two-component system, chemotaxis family, protein-glutamate methylesterase/glutaminase